jgi:hypothetical protein
MQEIIDPALVNSRVPSLPGCLLDRSADYLVSLLLGSSEAAKKLSGRPRDQWYVLLSIFWSVRYTILLSDTK